MKRRFRFLQTVQTKLIIIYVLMILVGMQLIGIYFYKTMETSFLDNFKGSLNNQATLLAEYVRPFLSEAGGIDDSDVRESIDNVVANFNKISGAEIQVIDPSRAIISSSLGPTEGQQMNTQIEVIRALNGVSGNEWDVVDSLGARKRAVVAPVMDGANIIGAVYIVQSMEDLFDTIDRIKQIFIAGTMIALGLTTVLGIVLSNTITNPIKQITNKATEMAKGNFNQRVRVQSRDEIGRLGYAFNDMTRRLKDALSSIEEEKDKLASILSNMSDGVIATDESGRTIVINRRAHDMLQLKEDEGRDRSIGELLDLTEQEVKRYTQEKEQTAMVALERPEREDDLYMRVTFTPIYRRDRGISGMIIVLRDVTEQEKLEQNRKEFVANVSHELRTPLTSINSYLEALDDGAVDEPELAKQFLKVTRNETERMIRLVSDLLQLSRLDSKQSMVRKRSVEAGQMIEDVADRFSLQLQRKKVTMTLQVEKNAHTVFVDTDQIDQVLDNVVSNAVKYTSTGGSIMIAAKRVDVHWIEIVVQDTGSGIPQADIERIFERFYRVDKGRSRSMGGTGLGLSIAREIIKAHGGDITLESEVGRGTKVSITLPSEEVLVE